MGQQLRIRRTPVAPQKNRFVSAVVNCLPEAWFSPASSELVALYKLRYRMALEERKYDSALIFLNKILEVEPLNLEAKLCKGEIYHRHMSDYGNAVDHYNKVLRLTSGDPSTEVHQRARKNLSELMEMLS